MEFIRKPKWSARGGYCYLGWDLSGCKKVCHNQCLRVCLSDNLSDIPDSEQGE